MAFSLVSYGESSDSEPEETTVSSKKDDDRDVRKLLSVLPPAKFGSRKRGKQPVRIGLPQIQKGDESDSDDEGAPSAKRQKSLGGGGGGLTAILPKPKGGSRLAAVANKPATTKSMVPYTLSKRYQDSKNKTKAKAAALKKAKKLNSPEDSDSDGDEPVSFFSHLDEPRHSSDPVPDLSDSHVSGWSNSHSTAPHSRTTVPSYPSTEALLPPGPTHLANSAPIAPKPFRIADPNYDPVTGIYSYGEHTAVQPPPPPPSMLHQGEGQAEVEQASSSSGSVQPRGWEQYYSQAERDLTAAHAEYYEEGGQDSMVQQQQGPVKPMPGAGPGLSIDDDVFRRLAGGKKRKNWQENLNDIIDIKEDDVKEEIKIYQKYYSEDAVNKLYKPDPSSKDPTSQQKRKHQLTFLAHQAKANELKLLKQWGQAASTKKQTQMKYGF